MIFGGYGSGREELPRVIRLSVSRYTRALPAREEPLSFLVSIHEEGTGITWQRNADLGRDDERFLLEATTDLHRWSLNLALTPEAATRGVEELGRRLHDLFVGDDGRRYLEGVSATAYLLGVDETILNLPWELIRDGDADALAERTPFGRLVATRTIPRQAREPAEQDREVRILAVADPSGDLGVASAELKALEEVEGDRTPFSVRIDVLEGPAATREAFGRRLKSADYDILHFAGHASFDARDPEASALRFADGALTADDVLDLPWQAPPGLVFNSACESGRGAGGKRLVSRSNHANGLAAAFLAAGTAAYAGYFWPVTNTGANLFASVFYQALFQLENVGLAFREARRTAVAELGARGDLTGYGAVLFGDAASKHRRDLATAA